MQQLSADSNFLFPSKQIINGQAVSMIFAFYSPPPGNVSLEPRVTMMDSGMSFPVLNLQNFLANTDFFEIRGNLLIGNSWDLNDTPQMSVISIDCNSSNFLIRQQLIRTGPFAHRDDGWFSVDSSTNNGSVLPAYLRNDDTYGLYGRIYRDDRRDITARFVSAKGDRFDAMHVKGKLVVGATGVGGKAVAVCP